MHRAEIRITIYCRGEIPGDTYSKCIEGLHNWIWFISFQYISFLQFNWLAFMKEMFTGTGVVIQADEPIISFKGPFFADFSNLLANTNTKVLGKSYCLHHSLWVFFISLSKVHKYNSFYHCKGLYCKKFSHSTILSLFLIVSPYSSIGLIGLHCIPILSSLSIVLYGLEGKRS